MRGERYVVMDQAGGDAGGGAGGGSGAPAQGNGAGAAAAPAPAPGGGAAGAGAGGDGGAAKPLLAAGEAAAAGVNWLPDQFQVRDDKGALSIEQSARKLAGSYAELAGKMRDTGMPPKEAKDYTIAVPEPLKGKWEPEKDQMLAGFRDKAHAAGLTQKQFDFVIGEYLTRLPALRETAKQADIEQAKQALAKVWKTPEALQQNLGLAFHAARTLAGSDEALERIMDKFGNDADFLQIMAKIGPELREDKSPGSGMGVGTRYAGMPKQELMQHEAYTNAKHPDHQLVSALVRRQYEQQFGSTAAL